MQKIAKDIYERLVNAKLFIDTHFNEPIDLAAVSASANISAFHFHRLFTKVYRITPHQYITRKRLFRAKELLNKGSENVSDVCIEIGFESPGSFSTLFKKHHGLSPQGFRNHAAKQKSLANKNPRFVIPGCFLSTDDKK